MSPSTYPRNKLGSPKRGEQGIALVSIIFITTVIIILAFTLSVVSLSEFRSVNSNRTTNDAIQAADAVSERARRLVVDTYNQSNLTVWNFLSEAIDDNIPELAGVQTFDDVNGFEVRWEVARVAERNSQFGNNGWIDVAATAERGGTSQTVIRRVGFGENKTFELAMLSENTDCMYCHIKVNGDVGQLEHMRPGWGKDRGGQAPADDEIWRDGWCAGGSETGKGETGAGNSRINGNVYGARTITDDCTNLGGDDKRINGLEVSGDIEANSTNDALPDDLDGDEIPDFPPITRDVARANAIGTVSGGTIRRIPLGGTVGSSSSPGSLGPDTDAYADSNLILIGTPDDPIDLDGDIYVEGDIIIRGVVRGIGAIYAGRNIYVAGDVEMETPPYFVDDDGECVDSNGSRVNNLSRQELEERAAKSGKTPSDVCAEEAIADQTDALRLGARGSIITGDYTEYQDDAHTQLQGYDRRQSADFYKQQFGFREPDTYGFETEVDTHYYDKDTGDELRCQGTVCKNADGEIITNKTEAKIGSEAYDYSFRPGHIDTSGNFKRWISDAQYQQILGEEQVDHNTWRWSFTPNELNSNEAREDGIKGLMDSGFSRELAEQIMKPENYDFQADQWNQFNDGTYFGKSTWPEPIKWTNPDTGEVLYYHWQDENVDPRSGASLRKTLRIMETAPKTFETQVNRIDAFLYANQRIAGKTSMQAMSVTGGLIAKDLGILAPGRTVGWPWDNITERGEGRKRDPKIIAERINSVRNTTCEDETSPNFVYRSDDCALTVNYDHRLRNGGYGFNVVTGKLGLTVNWYVADSREERVQ